MVSDILSVDEWMTDTLTSRSGPSSSDCDVGDIADSIVSCAHDSIVTFLLRRLVSSLYSGNQTSDMSAIDVGEVLGAARIDFGNDSEDRVLITLVNRGGICCGQGKKEKRQEG